MGNQMVGSVGKRKADDVAGSSTLVHQPGCSPAHQRIELATTNDVIGLDDRRMTGPSSCLMADHVGEIHFHPLAFRPS